MDKDDMAHIYNRILLSHKKEWNNAICSNMDGPRDYHTNWSKSERQISYDITYMYNLKYDTGKPVYRNRNRFIDIESKLIVTKGGTWHGGGIN